MYPFWLFCFLKTRQARPDVVLVLKFDVFVYLGTYSLLKSSLWVNYKAPKVRGLWKKTGVYRGMRRNTSLPTTAISTVTVSTIPPPPTMGARATKRTVALTQDRTTPRASPPAPQVWNAKTSANGICVTWTGIILKPKKIFNQSWRLVKLQR